VIIDGMAFIPHLRYSPDGKQIVFYVQLDGNGNRVYIMDSNGNNLKLLIELEVIFTVGHLMAKNSQ